MSIKTALASVMAIFGGTAAVAEEQAIIVSFDYGLASLVELHDLENTLRTALAAIGEYDGHEIAADLSHGFLYMYGPDANALAAIVLPIFRNHPFMNGAKLEVRYGEGFSMRVRVQDFCMG